MNAPARLPISIHEATVERHFARDPRTQAALPDDAIAGLATAVRTARTNLEQLGRVEAALKADPTRPPEAKAMELRRAALTLGQAAGENLDTARARATREIDQITATTWSPPAPRDPASLSIATELRSVLRAMSQDERSKTIEAALQGGDGVMLGAVLGGPAMLSGLADAQLETLRARWREQAHPAAADRQRRLEAAVADLDRAAGATVGVVERAANADGAVMAENRAAAATAALDAVEGLRTQRAPQVDAARAATAAAGGTPLV